MHLQGMRSDLEALQPQLIASSAETADLMRVISAQTAEADKVKVVVQVRASLPSCSCVLNTWRVWLL